MNKRNNKEAIFLLAYQATSGCIYMLNPLCDQLYFKFLMYALSQIISGLQNFDKDNVASVVIAADKVCIYSSYEWLR